MKSKQILITSLVLLLGLLFFTFLFYAISIAAVIMFYIYYANVSTCIWQKKINKSNVPLTWMYYFKKKSFSCTVLGDDNTCINFRGKNSVVHINKKIW